MKRSRIVGTVFALLATAALVTAVSKAADAGVAKPAATDSAAALDSSWYASAPYLMPLSNDPPDATSVMAATGQKAFQPAFILAPNDGGCVPTWDGITEVSSDTAVHHVVSKIRAAGGDVSVSVGGYGGTKLGQVCDDVAATAAAYQQVVDAYDLKAIDFDLEVPEYEDSAAVTRELGAAQTLQQNNPGIYISVTMPGTSEGTGDFGTQLLDEAQSLGFTPDNFSIMPFDGGFDGGSAQVSALKKFHSLLMSHLGWNSATAYAHEGFSGMDGKSDTSEYFRKADFKTVLKWATAHGLNRFTFWSVNRDRKCGSSTDNGICSNVDQADWDFTRFAAQFAGYAPPSPSPHPPSPTPSPSPTPTPTPSPSPTPSPTPSPSSCVAPAWRATAEYSGGAVVSYDAHEWAAKWWTQGDVPGNNDQGVWIDNGRCSGTQPPPSPGTCVSRAWRATAEYSGGAVVSYNAHEWAAKWWTQGDVPGNNDQGVWTDNGTC